MAEGRAGRPTLAFSLALTVAVYTPVPFAHTAAVLRLSSPMLKQEGEGLMETTVQRHLSPLAEQAFKYLGT